jgi:hypothetical protein
MLYVKYIFYLPIMLFEESKKRSAYETKDSILCFGIEGTHNLEIRVIQSSLHYRQSKKKV